jgi:hypothetical protein
LNKNLNHESHATQLSLVKDKAETGKIIFTTNRKDKEHHHTKGNPICFVAPNISSFAGGNANLWRNSFNTTALRNPYGKKNPAGAKKQVQNMQTSHQRFDDDKLEFVSFYKIPSMALGRCYRTAQERGPIEIKFRDIVSTHIFLLT